MTIGNPFKPFQKEKKKKKGWYTVHSGRLSQCSASTEAICTHQSQIVNHLGKLIHVIN